MYLFIFFTEITECGTDIVAVPNGEIVSPNYPYRYPANAKCISIIKLPPGSSGIIKLTFLAFETEPSFDKLEVRDGNTASSPLLDIYSGSSRPPSIDAASGAVWIK